MLRDIFQYLGPFFVLGLTAWMFINGAIQYRRHKLAKMQAELHAKLLDRFGTAEEVLSYLESQAGRRLLETASLSPKNPTRRILGSIQAGVVLLVTSVVALILVSWFGFDDEGFLVVTGLGIALGVGFLASGVVALYLSRNWGLIDGQRDDGGGV